MIIPRDKYLQHAWLAKKPYTLNSILYTLNSQPYTLNFTKTLQKKCHVLNKGSLSASEG